MAESTLLTGKVKAISEKNKSLCIDEKWYEIINADKQRFGDVKRGAEISFKWKKGKNEKGYDCMKIVTPITIVKEPEAKKEWKGNKGGFKGKGGGWKEDPKKQTSIVRQACIKAAAEIVAAINTAKTTPEAAADQALAIAEKFAEWCDVQAAPKPKEDKIEEDVIEEEVSIEEEIEEEAPFDTDDELEDDTPY